ncbi:MAG: dTMP kinase [Kiritimatiellae bacterium]|nr:dTMP kinase [Kiritimatiellia bacterium]MBR5588236.1 dTMP kinase [Kiritimatiellia bacterium]
MTRGRFITFEGPEGAGKSTHLKALAEKLKARGIPVLTTREPGGTLLGELVRKILQFNEAGEAPVPTAELLLFLASRAQLVNNVILPALERGEWVLSDRFCDSTFAYQGYGRGMDVAELRAINAFATQNLMPDVTLLLDIPQTESRQRVADRQGQADRFEQERDTFHLRLAEGFRELAKQEPQRIRRIDSTQPQADTEAAVWAAITPLLP